ncbi:uncharacterized protein si:ch73-345f18.3 [Trichomycterus rosablanca]|uniref:uncharacterized protein si:ch73-345f18.3 n=1 Tax=Trichomycterus rosablanca TaxID=2290929 RepID=UPI002F359FFF
MVRYVGKADLDHRFSEFGETFEKQQKNFESMKEKRQNLMDSYHCSPDDSLSKCLQKIKEEHYIHQVQLQMKGYDFSLTVTPDDNVPDKLKQTQENIKELCQAVKAIMAVGPKLEAMTSWLLKEQNRLTVEVKEEAKTYQDAVRLGDNLKGNLQVVSQAKQLSPLYRKQATKICKEVAELSGCNP